MRLQPAGGNCRPASVEQFPKSSTISSPSCNCLSVPLNGCTVVFRLSSLKKKGVGWAVDDPSFLLPLRGGCGLVKSYWRDTDDSHFLFFTIFALQLFSFYLFGNLAKVADVSQDCAFDEGVASIPAAFLSIEVRVERVHAFYCSRTLLPVPKNQVDPQVEVGTHVVTFQGLREIVANN